MRSRPKIKFKHWWKDGQLHIEGDMKTEFGLLRYHKAVPDTELAYSTLSVSMLLRWNLKRIQRLMNHQYWSEVERNQNA